MFALFDLPVKSRRQRREATAFRHHLLGLGFTMLQYSVYARPCNRESDAFIIRKIEQALPIRGRVAVLTITDKQYGAMHVYRRGLRETVKNPEQFTLF
jgi:CRISPR-associated protein Cas2